MKFKWSKESIALQPSDCKAEQNENVILNQRLVDIFEAHHYCSTTKCWIVVDDLEGYACFVAHIDPECPGDTNDEYFAEGLELTDEERAWLETCTEQKMWN